MILEFRVPGEACAQGRPRFTSFTGKDGKTYTHAYDPAKSKNYKSFVKQVAIAEMDRQGWLYNEIPLRMSIVVFMTIPSAKSKKFKEAALNDLELPNKKPDVDNIAKTIMDSLSGIVYKDDKQIVFLTVSKHYSEQPYVMVRLSTIEEPKND